MKHRLLAVAGLVLAALLVPALATSASQQARPHMAVCVAPVPNPFADPVEVNGTCLATHLGLDRFTSRHRVETLLETFDPATLSLAVVITNGSATHVAPNGAELYTRYAGTGRLYLNASLEPVRIAFDLAGTFEGGTKRFAGASGTSRIQGELSLVTGIARFAEHGRITY